MRAEHKRHLLKVKTSCYVCAKTIGLGQLYCKSCKQQLMYAKKYAETVINQDYYVRATITI